MRAHYAPLAAAAVPPPDDTPPFGSLFDHASTLLLVLTRDGVVLHANASAVRYANGDELLGRVAWESALVERSPAAAAALRDAVARTAADDQPVTLDLERRDGSGTVFTADFTISGLAGRGTLLAEGRDVTARRARDQRRHGLLGTAAHELRTPLVGVRSALAMLEAGQAGRVDSRARDLVRLARANADRLMRCVTDLLDLEHIRAGIVPVAPLPASAGDIARAAVDALTPLATQRRVRLTMRDLHAGRVLADHDRTAQALATLLSYAVYAATGGTLRVTVTRAGAGRVRIAVDDPTGAIPAERRTDLVRQIERAACADTPVAADRAMSLTSALTAARDSDTHAGLGVAIARALVERQGGTVGASAEADRTTVCWVELPAADDPTVALVLID